jgi:SAM-dependent methyltransferase
MSKDLLQRTYWKLESLIDPGVSNSHEVYAGIVTERVPSGSVWLEVGCGHEIFGDWLPSGENLVAKCDMVVGIDYDFGSLQKNRLIRNRIVGDIHNLPCRDGAFDLITANMVMEHVSDPVGAMKSVKRLLKPNGIFIFHTPNYWHYAAFLSSIIPQKVKNKLIEIAEGREEDDVFPTFYKLNDVPSIVRAAKAGGLEIREFHKLSCSSTGTIMLLGPLVILDLLFRRLTRWKVLENFRANFVVVLQKPSHD